MVATFVGFKKFKSKAGNDCCIANITVPFTPDEEEKGGKGINVQSFFMPEEQRGKCVPENLGKDVEIRGLWVKGAFAITQFEIIE